MKPQAGVVVEFVGVSGAGKSTLSRTVAGILERRGIPFMLARPLEVRDVFYVRARRRLFKRVVGVSHVVSTTIRYALRDPDLVRTYVNVALSGRSRKALGIGIAEVLSMFQFASERRARMTDAGSDAGVHLCDEGEYANMTFQHALGFPIDSQSVARAVRRIGGKHIVVVLTCRPSVQHQRVIKRKGHPRAALLQRNAEWMQNRNDSIGRLQHILDANGSSLGIVHLSHDTGSDESLEDIAQQTAQVVIETWGQLDGVARSKTQGAA
jgi:shikimate kinase